MHPTDSEPSALERLQLTPGEAMGALLPGPRLVHSCESVRKSSCPRPTLRVVTPAGQLVLPKGKIQTLEEFVAEMAREMCRERRERSLAPPPTGKHAQQPMHPSALMAKKMIDARRQGLPTPPLSELFKEIE